MGTAFPPSPDRLSPVEGQASSGYVPERLYPPPSRSTLSCGTTRPLKPILNPRTVPGNSPRPAPDSPLQVAVSYVFAPITKNVKIPPYVLSPLLNRTFGTRFARLNSWSLTQFGISPAARLRARLQMRQSPVSALEASFCRASAQVRAGPNVMSCSVRAATAVNSPKPRCTDSL